MPKSPLTLLTLAVLTALFAAPAVAVPPVRPAMITAAVVADSVVVWAWYVLERPRERRQRRTRRRRQGLCRDCGYDLFGNASGVCPECGARRV